MGIVGHDLRNPLTAIVTSAQLLLHYAGLNDRQSRVVRVLAMKADQPSPPTVYQSGGIGPKGAGGLIRWKVQ